MGLSGQRSTGENPFCLAKLVLSFSKPKRCPLPVKGAPRDAPWAARALLRGAGRRGGSRAEGRVVLHHGAGSLQLSFFSKFAAVQATALTLQPQSRGQARAFPCGCPPGQCGVSGSTWQAPGWGGRMVLGAAAYGGEGREEAGRGIAIPSLTPLPSPSRTPPGAGHHDIHGFIVTSQYPENCSFLSAHGAGYQFGPAPSQRPLANCASVSLLEPALPNLPLFPSTPGATSPAAQWRWEQHMGEPRSLLEPSCSPEAQAGSLRLQSALPHPLQNLPL